MKTKSAFFIDNYLPDQKVVMHCKTEAEASDFLEYLNSQGRKWCTGKLYTEEENHFDKYRESTCYNFVRGAYGYIEYYQSEGYTILEYGDFDWNPPPGTDISFESFLGVIST